MHTPLKIYKKHTPGSTFYWNINKRVTVDFLKYFIGKNVFNEDSKRNLSYINGMCIKKKKKKNEN